MDTCILIALASILLGLLGQISWKYGLKNIEFSLSTLLDFKKSLSALSSPLILLGFFLYAASAVLWLVALKMGELSKLYPLLSINFALSLLAGWLLFGEHLSAYRVLGVTLIIIGVLLVSHS